MIPVPGSPAIVALAWISVSYQFKEARYFAPSEPARSSTCHRGLDADMASRACARALHSTLGCIPMFRFESWASGSCPPFHLMMLLQGFKMASYDA